jgi:TetR/AcrR family transcriptional repressor of nem operon
MKEKLIRIATDTVQRAGVHSITMRDLGSTAGIRSSSVMYHFENKNGLLQQISSSYLHNFFEQLEKIKTTIDNPGERLQSLVDLFDESLNTKKMCLCGMMAAEFANLDNKSQVTIKLFFTRLEEWVATQLLDAKANPGSAPLIVSSLEGAMLLDRMDNDSVRLKTVREWIITLTG